MIVALLRDKNGKSPAVKAKWPRWFDWNVRSKPSLVSCRSGTAMTPALFIKTSMSPRPSFLYDWGNSLTDSRSSRSRTRLKILEPVVTPFSVRYDWTASTDFSPLAVVRAVKTIVAPAAANRFADSNPNPVLPPVIRTTLSVKEPAGGSYGPLLLAVFRSIATAAPAAVAVVPNTNPPTAPTMKDFRLMSLIFFAGDGGKHDHPSTPVVAKQLINETATVNAAGKCRHWKAFIITAVY
mmetsp:Transcript_3262/g.7046  ORF Transcript_3262/g.7046 Transcript_3262/m.7046 type:complete len:238 (+) Transcript_3262:3680-4393(+)